MKSHPSRFQRMALWRQVDRIVELADACNPGDTTWEQELGMTARQIRRQLERSNDFDEIARRALALRDAIGSLR